MPLQLVAFGAVLRLASDVIVALDCSSRAEVDFLLDRVDDSAQWFKVGIQTLVSGGPAVAGDLVSAGKSVFLDLKLHEVPNSVAGAVAAAGELGSSLVSVHASGGRAVLDAAVEAADRYPDLHVVALTVITSLGDYDMPSIGIDDPVAHQVDRLAALAREAGCDGVVCSVHEAPSMRRIWGERGLVITPGIALSDSGGVHEASDQVRVATPELARQAGASHIVLGRSLASAVDLPSTYGETRRRFLV